jgi:hypothetical protein
MMLRLRRLLAQMVPEPRRLQSHLCGERPLSSQIFSTSGIRTLVLPFWLLDYDRNGGLAVADVARPIGIPKRRQAARDRLVEAVRRNLDGMFDSLDVATGDSAGPKPRE